MMCDLLFFFPCTNFRPEILYRLKTMILNKIQTKLIIKLFNFYLILIFVFCAKRFLLKQFYKFHDYSHNKITCDNDTGKFVHLFRQQNFNYFKMTNLIISKMYHTIFVLILCNSFNNGHATSFT